MKHEYFGIDIGDGETAVSYVVQGTNAFPSVLEIQGETNMPTAISITNSGECLIGSSAKRVNANISSLNVRFKSRFLFDEKARTWMERFARALRERIQATGHMTDMHAARIYIGCPSGWDEAMQETYLSIMRQAGFENVTIAKESRAAMLYAREASELRLTMDQLLKPFLIIDSGSSTTDFTYVYKKSIADWGEVALGGGVLDELLLDYNLQHGEIDPQGVQVIEKEPLLRANAELLAREVKELYFDAKRRGDDLTYPIEKAEKYYVNPPVRVTISCATEIMDELLDSPCQQFNGKSYKGFFKSQLTEKKRKLPAEPETVLLTGGASQMDFIETITQEVFPKAQVHLGVGPEFAIAHGLCLMQRTHENCKNFQQDVQDMIQSDAIENVVQDRLPELFQQLVPIVMNHILEVIIPQVFGDWQDGTLLTIKLMMQKLEAECKRMIREPAVVQQMKPITANWLQELRPTIEAITTPICIKNGIEPARLSLPNFFDVKIGAPISSGDIINLDFIETIVTVVAVIVGATICGGAGTALIAAGPGGWIAGALLALLIVVAASKLGKDAALDFLYSMEIPVFIRKLVSQKSLLKKLHNQEKKITDDITRDLTKQIKDGNQDSVKTIAEISAVIEKQLLEQMQDAMVMLN